VLSMDTGNAKDIILMDFFTLVFFKVEKADIVNSLAKKMFYSLGLVIHGLKQTNGDSMTLTLSNTVQHIQLVLSVMTMRVTMKSIRQKELY